MAPSLNIILHNIDRHDDSRDQNIISYTYKDASDYMRKAGGYTANDISQFETDFPPLLTLDVERHLKPKMRFLKYTLGGVDSVNVRGKVEYGAVLNDLGRAVPPQYYGARLERTVAPRHAFLVAANLPHGPRLLEDDCKLFKEFLSARKSKQFATLCNQWKEMYGNVDECQQQQQRNHQLLTADFYDMNTDHDNRNTIQLHNQQTMYTAAQVDAFEAVFQRGIMAAARDELQYRGETLEFIDAGHLVKLLVQHGANPCEVDIRGVSLLHWAAGAGNKSAVLALSSAFGGMDAVIRVRSQRDGATILHWAAAGAVPKHFGTGGHIGLCTWFLEVAKAHVSASTTASGIGGGGALDGMDFFLDEDDSIFTLDDVVNAVTFDGNSVLMWAAWSGSFDIVKLILENGADISLQNENGCSVAHWAASGGHLEICKFLADEACVDFDVVNIAGNSPLSHAVAFGRSEVVVWLQDYIGGNGDDGRAGVLAKMFVDWSEGQDEKRKEILDMFPDFM